MALDRSLAATIGWAIASADRFSARSCCSTPPTRLSMSMTNTREMLEAAPAPLLIGTRHLAAAIDACFTCVQACTECADSDLVEPDVANLRTCIALNHICADVCDTTARVLSQPSQSDLLTLDRLVKACVRACVTCAEECARHAAHHRHCAICEDACRACVRACTVLLAGEAFQNLQKCDPIVSAS